jgi:hypothetical protein
MAWLCKVLLPLNRGGVMPCLYWRQYVKLVLVASLGAPETSTVAVANVPCVE